MQSVHLIHSAELHAEPGDIKLECLAFYRPPAFWSDREGSGESAMLNSRCQRSSSALKTSGKSVTGGFQGWVGVHKEGSPLRQTRLLAQGPEAPASTGLKNTQRKVRDEKKLAGVGRWMSVGTSTILQIPLRSSSCGPPGSQWKFSIPGWSSLRLFCLLWEERNWMRIRPETERPGSTLVLVEGLQHPLGGSEGNQAKDSFQVHIWQVVLATEAVNMGRATRFQWRHGKCDVPLIRAC